MLNFRFLVFRFPFQAVQRRRRLRLAAVASTMCMQIEMWFSNAADDLFAARRWTYSIGKIPHSHRIQKYNVITFLPLVLFEQFRFFLNLYFLVMALSQFIPSIRIGYLYTYWGPLCFVLAVTLFREAIDDFRRYRRDKQVNKQLYERVVLDNNSTDSYRHYRIEEVPASALRVGDIVTLHKGERVPADMILLRTNDATGTIYIRTDQLDGETDWKLRIALPTTQKLSSDTQLLDINAQIFVEKPEKDIHSFIGTCTRLDEEENDSLDIESTLWSGCVVASGQATGLVIYTDLGKIFYSWTIQRDKKIEGTVMRSTTIPEELGRIQYLLADKTGTLTKNEMVFQKLHLGNALFDATNFHEVESFLTQYVTNDGPLIASSPGPTSDLNSLSPSPRQIWEVVLAIALCHNVTLVYEEQDVEEAQSDMTSSVMSESCGGAVPQQQLCDYQASSPDEVALVKWTDMNNFAKETIVIEVAVPKKNRSKRERVISRDTSLGDARTMHGQQPEARPYRLRCDEISSSVTFHPMSKSSDCPLLSLHQIPYFILKLPIGHFLLLQILYTFVKGRRRTSNSIGIMGISLYRRDLHNISLKLRAANEILQFNILQIFPFTSESKMMGVIVQEESTGEITYYVKGADVALSTLVSPSSWLINESNRLAAEGLRTLVIAKKSMTKSQYEIFEKEYKRARSSMTNRSERTTVALSRLQYDLTLLGLTGVEDRLADDVPRTLGMLHTAGIKVWMLTGDKLETALCIARSLRLGGGADYHVASECINRRDAHALLERLQRILDSNEQTDLIIEGETLQVCLQSYEDECVEVLKRCPAVVVARCSPTQKARVAKLLRARHYVVAAVGDGGNDVAMLQEADIGVGIEGVEGKTASLAGDVSVRAFSALAALFLVHGRRSVMRYDLKQMDIQKSKNNPKVKVITVDLQKCLPTPLLSCGLTFYKRKLWTLNFTIFDASDSSAHSMRCL
ncbi:Probable phospholipid-transporting ATPase IIB [Eumeta japonica]|uniref:Probable phospholipid-transporting ATPase IIB n=1 Tax=Eumeta variegata TaxID=151549 RepID=A0A4C1TWS2_EUMVA|nr:Probable phospholipid-transporting ATPase IIB [Eumeta japonica]